MKVYGYLRTSTVGQIYGIEAQRQEILASYPQAEFFEEHASGKAGSNRPEFDKVSSDNLAKILSGEVEVQAGLDALQAALEPVLANEPR